MRLYLAGPLFTSAERSWNSLLANNLRALGCEVELPQEFSKGIEDTRKIATLCLYKLSLCSVVVVNCDGADMDSGTAMEFGFAVQREINTIAYRTDLRRGGDCSKNVNLMVAELADAFISKPLGSYSEIGRSVFGYINRWTNES